MNIESILLVSSTLLLISLLAANRAFKYGIPTLLLFLAVGMLAGSEGIGGITFNNPSLAQFIGIVSLNFILFSGGLDTRWKAIKPVLWHGTMLSTMGVLVTAISLGLFIHWTTKLGLMESLLLGSIVSSTDAAAVFSILRAKSLKIRGPLRPMLELESGSNDPMAYVLTITFLSLIVHKDESIARQIWLFLLQMILGGGVGFLAGKYSRWLINRMNLGFEGLYPVLTMALMLLVFSLTSLINGNGFLAIYIMAVMLGNTELIHKNTINKVFDGLAWLMQIVLFLTLGLLVFPSHLVPVLGTGIMIAFFQILIARPLGVGLSLFPFRLSARDVGFVSWVGLRGAVPIVFATYPLIEGIEQSDMIFNIVFIISVLSVLVQGTSIPLAARWFGVIQKEGDRSNLSITEMMDDDTKTLLHELVLPAEAPSVGKSLVGLKFPEKALITMIHRNNEYFIPSGTTVLNAGDKLVLIASDPQSMQDALEILLG